MTLEQAIQMLRAGHVAMSRREMDEIADAIEGLCTAYNRKTGELAEAERKARYQARLHAEAISERDAAVKERDEKNVALAEATAVMMRMQQQNQKAKK